MDWLREKLNRKQMNSKTIESFFVEQVPMGAYEWMSRIFRQNANVSIEDIKLDSSGNVIIVGTSSSGVIQLRQSNETTLSTYNSGNTNTQTFIVKYNSSGKVQWLTWLKSSACLGYGLAIDSTDNVYACGQTYGAVSIRYSTSTADATIAGFPIYPINNSVSAYVISLTGNNGSFNWFRYLVFYGSNYISIDGNNLFVSTTSFSGGGNINCFDLSGNSRWSRAIEGAPFTFVKPLTMDTIIAAGEIMLRDKSKLKIVNENNVATTPIDNPNGNTSSVTSMKALFIAYFTKSNGNFINFIWITGATSVLNLSMDTNGNEIYILATANQPTISIIKNDGTTISNITSGPTSTSTSTPRVFLLKLFELEFQWIRWFDNIVGGKGLSVVSGNPYVNVARNWTAIPKISQSDGTYRDITTSTDSTFNQFLVSLDSEGNYLWTSILSGAPEGKAIIDNSSNDAVYLVHSPSFLTTSANSITIQDINMRYPADQAQFGGSAIIKFSKDWSVYVKDFNAEVAKVSRYVNIDGITGQQFVLMRSFTNANGTLSSAWISYGSKSGIEAIYNTALAQLNVQLSQVFVNIATAFADKLSLSQINQINGNSTSPMNPDLFSNSISSPLTWIGEYLKQTLLPSYTLAYNQLTNAEKNALLSNWNLDVSVMTSAIDLTTAPWLVPPGQYRTIHPVYAADSTAITVSGTNPANDVNAQKFRAFDGSETTVWESQPSGTNVIATTNPVWIQWTSPTPERIIGYSLRLERFGPRDFQLEARNTSTETWTLLDQRTGLVNPNGATSSTRYTVEYLFQKYTAPYTQFRITATRHQDTVQLFIRICEIRLLKYSGGVETDEINQLIAIDRKITEAKDGVDSIVQLRTFNTQYDLASPYVDSTSLQTTTRDIYNRTITPTPTQLRQAYINLATTLIESYKKAYSTALTSFTSISLSATDTSAATGETPSITDSASAQTQISTFAGHFSALVNAIKTQVSNTRSSYTSMHNSIPFPRTYPIPSSLVLSTTADQADFDATGNPYYVVRNNDTKINIVPKRLTGLRTTITDQDDPTKNGTYVVDVSGMTTSKYGGQDCSNGQQGSASNVYFIFQCKGVEVPRTTIWGQASFIQIQIPSAKSIIGYQIEWRSETASGTNPGFWELMGSNDGTTWATIKRSSNKTDATNSTDSETFSMPTRESYSYFRMNTTNIQLQKLYIYEYGGKMAYTKPDQLFEFQKLYKGAQDTLLRIKSVIEYYLSARSYIADVDLQASTLTTKNSIMSWSFPSSADMVSACRDILQTAIRRYWLLKNSADPMNTIVSTYAATPIVWGSSTIPTSDDVSSMSFEAMQAVYDKYFKGTAALWPTFINSLSETVKTAINSYRNQATAAGVAVDTTIINQDLIGSEIANADISIRTGILKYGRRQNISGWTNLQDASGNRFFVIGSDLIGNTYYYKQIGNQRTLWMNDGTGFQQIGGDLHNDGTSFYVNDYFNYKSLFYFYGSRSGYGSLIEVNGKTKTYRQRGLPGLVISSGNVLNLYSIVVDQTGTFYASAQVNDTVNNIGVMRGSITKVKDDQGTNILVEQTCNALCLDKNDTLYGIFDRAYVRQRPTSGGTSWLNITSISTGGTDSRGQPLNSFECICWDGTSLYVGGRFSSRFNNALTSTPINHLAKWNGTTWSAVNSNFNTSIVYKISVVREGVLYVSTCADSWVTSGHFIVSATSIINLGFGAGEDNRSRLIQDDYGSILQANASSTTLKTYSGTTTSILDVLNTLTLKYRIATFRFLYQSARRYITDTELLTSTTTTRSSIYTNVNVTYGAYLAARRDVLKTLITKYWLLNPNNATLGPSPSPATSLLPTSSSLSPSPSLSSSTSSIPTSDLIVDSTSDATLDALDSKYISGTDALWPALLGRIRSSVANYIDQYKKERADAVTRGDITTSTTDTATFIRDITCDADKASTLAAAVRAVSSAGVVTFTISSVSADSEYAHIVRIYSKYKTAIDTILSSIRQSATDALNSFSTYYNTTLASCLPLSSTTGIQAALDGRSSDTTAILAATSIPTINSYTSTYRKAIAELFNTSRNDQLSVLNRYVKLYNKYVTFSTNPDITGFGVSLAAIPTGLPTGTADQATLNGLPTATESALPTVAQIGSVGGFCTSYNGTNGFYNQLVSHVRTNLSLFIREFERRWATLSDDVRAAYSTSYTVLLTGGATELAATTTDDQLYRYMNQYAGLPQDSLGTPGPSAAAAAAAAAAAPTVSYSSTFSTAKNQADALVQIVDFGTVYLALQPYLYGSAAQMGPIATLIGTVNTIVSSPQTTLELAYSTVTSTAAPTFSTTFSNMVSLAQSNLNAILNEYASLYTAYSQMVTDFSGKAELPTLPALSSFSATAPSWTASNPMSGLLFVSAASGVYSQTTANSLTLFGRLDGYSDFLGYVGFADSLQPLLGSCITAVADFRASSISRIPNMDSIGVTSTVDDSFATTVGNSANLRTTLSTLGLSLIAWVVKEIWNNTWVVGGRYLSALDISTTDLAFIEKCRQYAIAASVTLTGTDTAGGVMTSAETTLINLGKTLASRYSATWTTWIEGGRVVSPQATLPESIAADMADGSERVRKQYLGLWPSLLADMKAATRTKVQNALELSEWKTINRTVAGLPATKLDM